MRILAVGDVCGTPGLEFLEKNLRSIRRNMALDFVVVNGENSNVVGMQPRHGERMFDAGADVITLGNHTWAYRDIYEYLDDNSRVIRPANFATQCPGAGYAVVDTPRGRVCVINLLGRYGLDTNTDHPFSCIERILGELVGQADVFLVDFHAEATSEKRAMGYFLDGRVSALWGTHTHVQTSDAQVLPGGTGYITDLGMTGPVHSVLGIEAEQSIGKFLGDVPSRYRSAKGPCKLEGCIFEIDEATGACLSAGALRIE
ncbi:MAG: TIGR00282 family metallophosphoesterase [Candidatus Heteroscillospira sp.]|jgi:metallophosphoesterase (TIGR00282 family)